MPQGLDQIKQETRQDTELKQLIETIVVGWPEKRRDVPKPIQPYWPFRDKLAVEDGLVLKGPRVVISQSLTAFLTVQCPKTCQQYRRSLTRETLIPHEVPTRPWQTLRTDLFEFEGENYLIIVDYYPKFPFIEKMPAHCTAKAVVEVTKKLFSEQGIPQKVVSDNGPQFSS